MGTFFNAEKLVDKFNLKKTKPFELAEDVLLKNGWICIRTFDVYKRAYDEVAAYAKYKASLEKRMRIVS